MRDRLGELGGMRAAACGLLAVLVAGAAMLPLLRSADWNPRVFAHLDSRSRLYVAANALDPGFRGVHSAGYDGQFYWGVAVDPLGLGRVHHFFDKPSYRYGHPLYGWLGWLVSGGRPRAVPVALVAVGLGSLALAAALAVALSIACGGSGWAGLFVALNVGLIVAAMNDLAEPLAVALMLGALLSLRAGWRVTAWCCLALLPLAKEPLLIVVAAAVGWELLRGHRRTAVLFATATIPALLWWIYARIRFGAWFTSGTSALGLPFVGWGQSVLSGGAEAHGSTWRHGLALAALVALFVVFAIGTARALRLNSREDLAYLGLTALVACLALNATAAFTTALRNVSFLVVLLPFVFAPRKGVDRDSLRAGKPIAAETLAMWERGRP